MYVFPRAQLATLATAYCDATGVSLHDLGAAVSHPKFFKRLTAGKGCRAEAAEGASAWFLTNWPDDAPWPIGVPRPALETAA